MKILELVPDGARKVRKKRAPKARRAGKKRFPDCLSRQVTLLD